MSETTNEMKPKGRKPKPVLEAVVNKEPEPTKEVLRIADIVDPGFTATVTKIIKSDIPMLTAFKLERSLCSASAK